TKGLGVDRHEHIGPSERYGFGPEFGKNADDEITRYGRVLVDPDPQTPEAFMPQKSDIAFHIEVDRIAAIGRIVQMTKCKICRQGRIGGTDGAFIILVDFAVGAIEFEPVAVIWNMAASDHNARRLLRDCITAQRRGRQDAAINRLKSRILD